MAFDLSTAKPASSGFDLSTAKAVEDTDYWDELKRTGLTAASNLGKMVLGAPNLMAGGLLAGYGELADNMKIRDLGEGFFKRMEQSQEMIDNENKPKTLVGKVGAGVAPMAAALATGGAAIPAMLPLGFGEQGAGLVRQGVGAGTAAGVAGIDTALNLAGGLVPGGRIVQALANPAVGAGSDVVNQQVLKSQGYGNVAKQYDPLDPERRLTDMVTGGMFPPQGKKKATDKGSANKINKLAEELAAAKAEFKPKYPPLADPVLTPMERMAQQLGGERVPEGNTQAMGDMAGTLQNREQFAQDALAAQRGDAHQAILDARQAEMEQQVKQRTTLEQNAAERTRQLNRPVDLPGKPIQPDGEQATLWDQPEMVQHGQKYMAESGDWRIDENGMPVRVDLSLDAQHAQEMLQRDMWVDESPEFAKIQETQQVDAEGNWLPPQETRSVAQSLDEMQRLMKRSALNKTQLGRDMEAPGSLEGAKLAAEREMADDGSVKVDFYNKPGMAEVTAALTGKSPFMGKGRKQAGAIDPEVFREGSRRLTRALSNLTDQPWVKAAFPADQYMTNSDGTPMILLHGTVKTIDGKLRPNSEGFHAGNPVAAHMFVAGSGKMNGKAVFNADRTKINGQIHPIVIKKGNYPYINVDAGEWTPEALFKKDNHAGQEVRYLIDEGLRKNGFSDDQINAKITSMKKNLQSAGSFNKLLKDAGIDGFFYKNTAESARGQAIADLTTKRSFDGAFQHMKRVQKNLQDGTSFVTYNKDNYQSLHGEGNERAHGDLESIPPFVDKEGKGQDSTPFFRNPNYIPKSQQGKVLFPFAKKAEVDQLKKIPGLKENLKAHTPDTATNEEFIAAHKNTPDISQNIVQRGLNAFTKGGEYMALKTDSPLIKRVVGEYLAGDNVAKAETGKYIHDGLAPALRDMTTAERTEVWGALNAASKSKTELTPDMLERAGYSPKQIEYIQLHKAVMGKMYEKMSEAMKASGVKPVDPIAAYVAGMSKGDFRTILYKAGPDGKALLDKQGLPEIAGIIGAKTKYGRDYRVNKFLEENLGYVKGDERYFGGPNKLGLDNSHLEMLDFLSKNDDKFKEFVDKANDMFTGEAYDFMNAKKHTLPKKGIFGMEGNKPWETAEVNAREGLEAQLRYAEIMIRWAEMAKAGEKVKPLMAADSELNMPNAKAYLQDYITNALGKNPTAVGHAIDQLSGAFGKATGLGTSAFSHTASGLKSVTNGILLGFANPLFLAANIIQPIKTAPEMMALLRSKGVEGTGTGYMAMGEGASTMLKDIWSKDSLSSVEKGALDYAKKHHVYSSDLFESGNQVSKNTSYYWQKGTQFGAAQIEQGTRKLMYLTYVNLLHKNGITPEDGLYKTAQHFTDMQMNNYSHMEAPMAYNSLGSAGRLAYNLMSYKHNELSRLAFLTKEMPRNKATQAFAINLMSQAAFGGLMGTILYQEADFLVRHISEWLGKPTSITKVLLENPEVSKYIPFGMAQGLGLDMHSRMGITLTPDVSQGLSGMVPGSGKLGQAVGAIGTAIKTPNEYNIKNAVREAAPLSMTGLMDRQWFSKQQPNGTELAMNRNKGIASATRNDADKRWKTIGGTGTNEATQKTLAYENQRIDEFYKEKQTQMVNNMKKEFFTGGRVDPKTIDKFIKYQGDPDRFDRIINNMAMEQNIPHSQLVMLHNAASKSITAAHSNARRLGKE